MDSRADHLAYCKRRALEYVDRGELQQAMISMISDLNAHPETQGSATTIGPLMLGLFMLPANASGSLQNPNEMRRFIEGFN